MMKKFFLLILPLVLFAVSCSDSDDGGGNNGPVQLAPGTKPVQEVYADEQQGAAPIKFTASAPWTATVVAVQTKAEAGSEVDWLTLSAYSGGAGEVSLTMELKPNLTGKDRKAEIRISCGGVTVTITVEQKGMTESGGKPEPGPASYALVESIEADFFVGCKEKYSRDTYNYEFRYDDKNRIAEYVITEYDYNNDEGKPELDNKYTTRFDYGIQGEIRLTEKISYDNNSDPGTDTETYRILLDDQGRAARFKEDGNDGYADSTITFTYNDEGRLARIWYGDKDNETSELEYEEMTYQNGVFTKVFHYDPYDTDEEIVFPADAFSDYPNDRLNIDPNWLLFTDPVEPEHMLSMLRLTGKGCDRLTLWLPNDDDDMEDWYAIDWYPEPNANVHKTHDYYEHKTGRLQYTFNDDGTIATIVQPVTCIQMRYEYDIVSGNEGNPEIGYKATQKNEKTSEVGRSTDQHKWTFTYRK